MRALLLGLFIFGTAASVHAEGAKSFLPQATYTDDGDSILPFNVQCASNSWTTLASSDSIRRGIIIQPPFSNTLGVCLSTAAATTNTCTDVANGFEVFVATPAVSVRMNTKAAIYCRSRALDVALQRLKGLIFRDTRDYGYISR